MPEYRIEKAVSGRAICKDSVCQKDKRKIEKDELRLGSWIEIQERGSWAWKHWGCVSGVQLEGLRTLTNAGREMDALDGSDALDADNLNKVKSAIEKGRIDDKDFNGDPECNVLGKRGIHLTEAKRSMKEAEAKAADNVSEEESTSAMKGAKRGRKKKNTTEDDQEPEQPVKKPKVATKSAAPISKTSGVEAKVSRDSDQDSEAETPNPVKRGPGRPRKSAGGVAPKAKPNPGPAAQSTSTDTRPRRSTRNSEAANAVKYLEESGPEDSVVEPEVEPEVPVKRRGRPAARK